MSEIELKYAPRKCKYFCCGDCSISGRSCSSDYPECRAAELKNREENPLLALTIRREIIEKFVKENVSIELQENARLKRENTELKEMVKQLNRLTGIFSARLLEKYKKALEEIREYIVSKGIGMQLHAFRNKLLEIIANALGEENYEKLSKE